MAHTLEELRMRQAMPLQAKVNMTKTRISQWVSYYGTDGVYVSFSGGKDSTVLLHIVRQMYPNIPAIFVDTGLEYPEIREFVKTFENVEWLKPRLTFKQVIQQYGYPFVSKEVSEQIFYARKYLRKFIENPGEPIKNAWVIADFCDFDKRTEKDKYKALQDGKYKLTEILDRIDTSKAPMRVQVLNGTLEHKEKGVPTGEISKMYNKKRWRFMLDAPFEVNNQCCDVMKKGPIKAYQKKTGRVGMTAQMADESFLRQQQWLRNGCNGFDLKHPISNPMSFWTEQDVLLYIKLNKIPICSVYGDVVAQEEIDGQMTMEDFGLDFSSLPGYDLPTLKTTGCSRTGCMFCGYGCHLEKPGEGRFERMKETHPKQYDYIMRPEDQGGLNYKEVIDWMNENGNLNIRY